MADTTVTNVNQGKSSLITKTTNAITDIRRILNEPAAKRALPTALALIVTFIGILLFISLKLSRLKLPNRIFFKDNKKIKEQYTS